MYTQWLHIFQGLPFQRVQHAVTTLDVQPTSDGALIIVVNGLLQVR